MSENPFEPRTEGESLQDNVEEAWYKAKEFTGQPTVAKDAFSGQTIPAFVPKVVHYEINVDAIESLDDVKLILKAMSLTIKSDAVDTFPERLVRKVEW